MPRSSNCLLNIAGKSAVKLSLQSMKDPYFYREHDISSYIAPLKSYLQGATDVQTGSLAVKVGLFNYQVILFSYSACNLYSYVVLVSTT